MQRIEHLGAHAAADGARELTLHALAHIAAQRLDAALGDAEGLAERIVDLGELLFLDGGDGDRELGGLARDGRAAVVGREVDGDAAGLARLRAAHALLELAEHLALAEHELDAGGAAALEGLAVDAAFEVDGHAVAIGGDALHRDIVRPLAAHGLEHRVDVGVGDVGGRALDGELRDRLDLDLGHDLEQRGEAQVCARLGREVLDARVGGGLQVLAAHSLGVRLAQQVAHDLGLHLRGELLAHHGERRLARAEALEARGLRELLEARLDLARDALGGDRDFQAALEARHRAH